METKHAYKHKNTHNKTFIICKCITNLINKFKKKINKINNNNKI